MVGSGTNYVTISGGKGNKATQNFGVIGGGCLNFAYSTYSSINGGGGNRICTSSSSFSSIGGGCCNVINGYTQYSFIGAGTTNFISSSVLEIPSRRSVIGGGDGNVITSSSCSIIGGGYQNLICNYTNNIGTSPSKGNSILGGGQNKIFSQNALTYTIVDYNTIGGGLKNHIYNYYSNITTQLNFIGGGLLNRICDSNYSVVGGGCLNKIYGNGKNQDFNSILGGRGNNVAQGFCNTHIIGSNITGNISDYTFVNNLCSFGQVNKAGGSFVISHPDPLKTKTLDLIHSFVESPTAGDNIYRFKVVIENGVGEIILPDYYKFLNENTQVWVSPINGFGIGYGEINEELTKIKITANLDMEYNVLVIGTRKDSHAKKYWKGTERPKNGSKSSIS